MKRNKGITLLALTVTIIVLIIITGITVNFTLGENGVITRAKETRESAQIDEEQKGVKIAAVEAKMESHSSNKTMEELLKEKLEEQYGTNSVTVKSSDGIHFSIIFNESGRTYKLAKNGTVKLYNQMEVTDIYSKIDLDGTLRLRSTAEEGYEKKTQWNSDTILKVIIEEPIAPTTAYEMFKDCINLVTINNIGNLHTENIVSMEKMFDNCQKLEKIDLSNFETSKVENMEKMFHNCLSLTELDVSFFDTSSVITMNQMFAGDNTNLNANQDYRMNLSNIKGLTSFNTSKVTDMNRMFYMCINLISLDLSSFDTKNVKDMKQMFAGNWYDTIYYMKLEEIKGIENFNTSNVENMSNMFSECSSIESLDLSKYNTEKVKDMSSMFRNCRKLKSVDVSNFDTKEVTTMKWMFWLCEVVEQLDLNKFDTSKVNNMNTMFANCYKLTTIYASNNFKTDIVTDSTTMFNRCSSLEGGAETKYSGDHTDKEYAKIDGGTSDPGYFTAKPVAANS